TEYTELYNSRPHPSTYLLRSRCLASAAQMTRYLRDRLKALDILQAVGSRLVFDCVQTEAGAILVLHVELRGRHRDFRIARRNINLPLEDLAVAQAQLHIDRPASHLPGALDAVMHIHRHPARQILRLLILHEAISECVETDAVIKNGARDRVRHRELCL